MKKILTALTIDLALLSFKGFVFMNLWRWFLMPITGIEVNLITSIGVCIIMHLCTKQYIEHRKDLEEFEVAIDVAFTCAACLFFGYIAQLFI